MVFSTLEGICFPATAFNAKMTRFSWVVFIKLSLEKSINGPYVTFVFIILHQFSIVLILCIINNYSMEAGRKECVVLYVFCVTNIFSSGISVHRNFRYKFIFELGIHYLS